MSKDIKKKCDNCKYFKDGKGFEDWCTNEDLNKQIDPDGVLDGWFTPRIDFYCSYWIINETT